jgi:hypothetical protein
MSLLGYINNGLNQSLNGIVTITDGNGTTISDGSVSSNSMTVSNFTATTFNATNLTLTGTITLPNGSILDIYLTSNVPLKDKANVFTNTNTYNSGLTVSSGLTLYNNAILDSYLSSNVPLLNINNTFTGALNTFNSLTLSSNSNFSQSGSGKITQTSSSSQNTLNPTQFLGDITFATGPYRINNANTATNILPTISCSNQLTLPNSQIINSSTPTLVDLSSSQNLSNKTLTTPIIAQIKPTSLLTLTLPALTDTLVSRTSTDTLTNKTLTTPIIASIKPNSTNTLTLPVTTDTIVCKNTTDTLTNKTINTGIFTNISTFNGYVDTNVGLGVNLGSYLSFNDTTGTIFSQIAQQTNNLSITNYGTGSIIFSSPVVDFTNTYSYFKGGISVSGYNTHFPYTDGYNYITGYTYIRGGGMEFTEGVLSLKNNTPISFFDTSTPTAQYSIFADSGYLNFHNYAEPINTGFPTQINFAVYNLDPTFPRFHNRLTIDYTAVQVRKTVFQVYDYDENGCCELQQTTGNSTILRNKTNSGSMILQTTNSSGSAVSNITLTPTNLTINTTSDFKYTSTYQSGAKVCLFESTNTDQTRIENLSTGFAITTEKQNGVINFNCYDGGFISQNVLSLTDSTIQAKKNITLPTTQTTQTSGQLGYIHQGTILSVSSPATINSGQVYYLGSMTLPVGVWNVFSQHAYVFTTGGNLTYENLSISTSATTISLNNCLAVQNISGTTGNNRLQRINGIFTSTGSTALYPTLQVGYSTGPVPQYTTTSQTYVRFYAVRIA